MIMKKLGSLGKNTFNEFFCKISDLHIFMSLYFLWNGFTNTDVAYEDCDTWVERR